MMGNKKVEFVSYTGEYPCLCMGVLTVKIDGKLVEFDHCMTSGGYCSIDFDGNGEDEIHSGPWSVHLPPEYEKYEQEITDLVNENVTRGCCGGCI